MKVVLSDISKVTNAPLSPNCSSIQIAMDKTDNSMSALNIDGLSEIIKFLAHCQTANEEARNSKF